MSSSFDDFYGSLDPVALNELLAPIRDDLIALALTHISHSTLPTMFVQIGIGMYYGYSAASDAYHSKSQYKMKAGKKSKVQVITDLIGSPRTSPLSALAYYVAGSLNNKYRTFFFAKEIYEAVQSPAPLLRKNLIATHKTFIPFCYPDFQYYNNTQSSYSRCYQAMYESSFERAHKDSQMRVATYYGKDNNGALIRYKVSSSPYGSFDITQEVEQSFLGKIVGSLSSPYSLAQLKSKLTSMGLHEGMVLEKEHAHVCETFQVIGYDSEQQACADHQKLRCLQITLPDDKLCDPMTDFEALIELIASEKPERIVFHQQKASETAQKNALVLASKINMLRRSSSLGFELKSLAYHSENPKEPINNHDHFCSFFSEVCTMGYHNPQQITEPMEVEEGSKIKSSHQQVTAQTEGDWPQTRVYHIKLQRPPFEWGSVPRTFLAMIFHDMLFEVYGTTIHALKDAVRSGNVVDVFKLITFIAMSIFSSAKFVIQLSLLPVRFVFSLTAASYLYLTGQNNNLFEIGPSKNFKAALKINDFAHTSVVEQTMTYAQPLLNFSPSLEQGPLLIEAPAPKKKKKNSKKRSSSKRTPENTAPLNFSQTLEGAAMRHEARHTQKTKKKAKKTAHSQTSSKKKSQDNSPLSFSHALENPVSNNAPNKPKKTRKKSQKSLGDSQRLP